MGIKRILGFAGLMFASGMLTGCWGGSWSNGGSYKGAQPIARQTTPSPSSIAQPSGWNNPQRTQDADADRPTGIQQPSVNTTTPSTGQPLPATSSVTPASGSSVDTMPSLPTPVRTL